VGSVTACLVESNVCVTSLHSGLTAYRDGIGSCAAPTFMST